MSAITLYELESELAAWADTLDLAETAEDRAEIQARIAEYLQQATGKRDRFAQFLAHLDQQIELAKSEEERLQSRQRRIESIQTRLKEYAVRVMETLGVRKLEGNTSTLALRGKPPSVLIRDQNAIPAEYQDVTVRMPGSQYLALCETLLELPSNHPIAPGTFVAAMNACISWMPDKGAIRGAIRDGKDVPGADLAIGGSTLVVR